MTLCSGWPISITTSPAASRSGRPARRRRRTRTRLQEVWSCPGDTRLSKPRPDGQREGALHLLAGAHAARADDALGRVEGEVGVGLVLGIQAGWPRRRAPGCRRRSRSARRAGRPRRPCPAARSRRWRRRSGSRAGGRRCRAPSRPRSFASAWASGCAPSCRARTGVVHEAGVPLRPSISTRHRRQEPKAPGCRWRTAWAPVDAGLRGRAHDRGAGGHGDVAAVDLSVTVGLGAAGCRGRGRR
jgi:hypothetical protein